MTTPPGAAEPPRAGVSRRHRVLRTLTGVGLAVAVAVVFGITTARAELAFGPHEATYETTTNATVTIDLGPLGTLQMDSPVPLLGVRVVVHEIPRSLTTVDAATTVQALAGDAESYLQFFGSVDATVALVVRALAEDATRRSAVALAVLLAAWFGGRALLGAPRRRELGGSVEAHRSVIVASTVLVLAAPVLLRASVPVEPAPGPPASAVFAGTALEGARVTGRLGGVINTYGGQLVAAYRANEAFYARADTAVRAAWEAAGPAPSSAPALASPSPLAPPAPALASPSSAAPASPSAPPAADDVVPVTVLLVSDLHCNVGMAPIIRSVAELSGAEVVADAGDTTMNGTSVEANCVTAFARAVPDGVDLVVSPGNHDSADTSAAYTRAGATVLDGSVVDVGGLRILGDADPRQTRAGAGTSTVRGETPQSEGSRLAKVACDDRRGVDILLVHAPSVGTSTLDRGCVPVQLSGHLHRRVGPLPVGGGVRYVSSTTAGAAVGQLTVGPLHATAELTVLRFDPASRRMLDYRVVQVLTDASARVGAWTPWPSPEPAGPAGGPGPTGPSPGPVAAPATGSR